ncbi:hypothetical protein ACFE04_025384 [Oxalis oulophora]
MSFGCECFCWRNNQELHHHHTVKPKPFSLPSPIPKFSQGSDFSRGTIRLGELEVAKVTNFDSIWSCTLLLQGKSKGVTFYKPAQIPHGFFCLGHYCQPDDHPLRGYVLVAHEVEGTNHLELKNLPALKNPVSYSLIWGTDSTHNGCAYFWLPIAPKGYKAMGIYVTDKPMQPELEEVRCVRENLTEACEACDVIISTESISKYPFQVWKTRPCERGMMAKGVSVGTFFCGAYLNSEDELDIACLKNLDCTLHAMPNLDQVQSLIKNYGPTIFFHPDEEYLPSSVPWFFKNGALLYRDGKSKGDSIDYKGSILPRGGENDSEYWIDLPEDDESRDFLKKGDLESTVLYVHVKPALGGTFTDIAMWVFCPFNGPATLKIGLVTVPMNKIGEHVGDWEHYTLRVSNFNGELWQIFFSEHSGGRWVDASELEFIEGNKAVVYSSKHGHASYAHAGMYLQGSSKLGIGLRNDNARSKFYIDSSVKYQIVAAEYLGDGIVEEPLWLQFMEEWGPTIVYDSRSELDKVINILPLFVRFSVENIFDLFPTELYGEEGPTGPKEKHNWLGDEIC